MKVDKMFEIASRTKLRFKFHKGMIAVEDLWELPILSLRELYKTLMQEKKPELDDDIFLTIPDNQSDEEKRLELKLEIIKYIALTKKNEEKEKEEAALKKQKKARIAKIIAEKEDEKIKSMPIEELEKVLNEL